MIQLKCRSRTKEAGEHDPGGHKLGIEKETVSRLETGMISPSLSRLEQLADIFGCTVRQFFWHESGNERAQANAIADMIRSLPESGREMVVRFVADVVRVLAV